MEIDKNHPSDIISSPAVTRADGKHPTSELCSTEEHGTKDCGDEDTYDGDSDSSSIMCPLFMDGLPSNFATNPQLAAIASLLNDDVPEETEDDKPKEESDTKDNSSHASSIPHHTRCSTPHITASRYWNNSAETRNRRQRQRVSPYPRQQQDRKKETQAKSKNSSVGEITLFMNMWKP